MAGKVFIHATMSLDGFIADPDGALDWAFKFRGPSAETVREIIGSIGAVLARRGAGRKGMCCFLVARPDTSNAMPTRPPGRKPAAASLTSPRPIADGLMSSRAR